MKLILKSLLVVILIAVGGMVLANAGADDSTQNIYSSAGDASN